MVRAPSRAEPVAVPQGAREEDDVVSEDLVEQDAKVRLAGCWNGQAGMGLVAHPDCKRWMGIKGTCSWAEPHEGSTLTQALLPSSSHKDLLEAGELKWGTDEAQFIYILGRRSKQHLRLGEHLLQAWGWA